MIPSFFTLLFHPAVILTAHRIEIETDVGARYSYSERMDIMTYHPVSWRKVGLLRWRLDGVAPCLESYCLRLPREASVEGEDILQKSK